MKFYNIRTDMMEERSPVFVAYWHFRRGWYQFRVWLKIMAIFAMKTILEKKKGESVLFKMSDFRLNGETRAQEYLRRNKS